MEDSLTLVAPIAGLRSLFLYPTQIKAFGGEDTILQTVAAVIGAANVYEISPRLHQPVRFIGVAC